MTLTLCDGTTFTLPLFDPVVANHVLSTHALVDTLIHQINKEKIYARFFEGKKGLTFLDIGANIGLVSLYASPACDRIVAVEPAPDTFKVLKSVCLSFNKITCVEGALSPKDGQSIFHVNDINSTASSTVNTYGVMIQVPAFKLISILKIYQLEHVDVCKCDAEGGEGESLTYEELQNAAPIIDTYYIETHNCPNTTWEHKMEILTGRLMRCGYGNISINGMAIIASK